MHFRIIKLTNNDNHKEFTLEITKMKDIRHRLGILESNYKDYLLSNERHKPSYNILSKSNYSYYCSLFGVGIILYSTNRNVLALQAL